MKPKGSKSTHLFLRKQLYQNRLNQLTQTINNKTSQLLNIKSRITQSKPILETIYHKAKLKEDYLEAELENTKRKLIRAEEKGKREEKISLETMRMVRRMALGGKYEGGENMKTEENQRGERGEGGKSSKNSRRFFDDLGQDRQRKNRGDDLDIEKSSPPKPVRIQHTYKQYQSKLNRARGNNQTPADDKKANKLKQKLKQVSKELKSGIDVIKKVREEFKHVETVLFSKGSKSEARFRSKKVVERDPSSVIDPQKALRFLQSKQRRLDQHRNK